MATPEATEGAIQGSCLCGAVKFEVDEVSGPFEVCHCNRCRKVSGAQGMPAVAVKKSAFRFISGADLIRCYSAPVLYRPPAYTSTFCAQCGSPVPVPSDDFDEVEIPAGLFDDDPGIKPDKHIFVEHLPAWDAITDGLPTFTLEQVYKHRTGKDLPPEFKAKKH